MGTDMVPGQSERGVLMGKIRTGVGRTEWGQCGEGVGVLDLWACTVPHGSRQLQVAAVSQCDTC